MEEDLVTPTQILELLVSSDVATGMSPARPQATLGRVSRRQRNLEIKQKGGNAHETSPAGLDAMNAHPKRR